ncbi:kinesin-like protein [Plasmopara halstedii]|uniref:Kinesin-like protein n=1 Tax=Plasmopara halstedii TaxID=4781 RepID=A0A0P1ABG9_PLAHL|nr:kinesin-like protein [Plasmopara halstedii]CEG37768.1 kinesin-like protein [Plasmopara halstedii]|eukprot:XP_024574137.1 kinesin-like protein [Plasmopara halstedii]
MATKSSRNDECVRVMVRIRPMSGKEVQDGRREATTANFDRAEVSIFNPVAATSEPPKSFTFDAAFGAKSTQQQVYDTAATEIVEAVMEGYNGTIFAYGQTGAGKSHTMEGVGDQPGIIPNSFKHIFDKVAISKNKRILVRASYLEIYNEEIRDLLSKDPKNALDLKENADSGVFVKGLTTQVVKDAAEIDHVMQTGKKNRSVGATLMNQTSSRSHSIFTIVVECLSEVSSVRDGKKHVCVGKLNLVDLAGSERQSKTGATGDRLQEANKINLSLSALGNVISALVDGKSKHIPYRDSKLTRLLQDSLGGNTKTVMIANCGPADYNYEETLTTLRYASRAKNIKNKPKINEDPKDAMIREFQEEIEALKAKLLVIEKQTNEGLHSTISAAPAEVVEVEKIVEKIVIEKGISIAEAQAIAEKAQREKEEMLQKNRDDLAVATKDKAQAEMNKRELELRLERERQQAEELAAQQKVLLERLAATQAKVLVGGEMMTKAAQQEDELRRTKVELEERKRQELQLARELAEQEESNLMREEKYQSLQEEAEAKARKLKKVYTKVKEVLGDIKAMEKAHNREKEDLFDTIRQLTAQLKLKNIVLNYFMPPEAVAMLEARARWNEEEDDFTLDHLELAGNTLRSRQRPPSASSVRRPETSSDKSRNGRKSMVTLNKDSDDELGRAEDLELNRNPFFMYVSDSEGDGYAPAAFRTKQVASSSGSRPKTARKTSSRNSSKRLDGASKRK